jgi:hypothetical protein
MNQFRMPIAIAAMIALTFTAGFAAVRHAGVLATSPAIAQVVYSGTLLSRRHLVLSLRLRTGRLLLVDATQAYLQGKVTQPLVSGESLQAQGILIAGVLIASTVKKP